MIRMNVPVWHYAESARGHIRWCASVLTMRNHIRHLSQGVVQRQATLVVHTRCDPFACTRQGFAYARPLRRSSVLANIVLLAYAMPWDWAHPPRTQGFPL